MNGYTFLDASFWIAYRDERQDLHEQAKRVLAGMFRRHTKFVTTLPVLCETYAHFSRNVRKKRVIIEDFENNLLVRIEAISPADQQQALELLRGQPDKSYSLCDAISFVIMRRLGLKRVLSFDRHFRQFGEFEIIP